MSVSIELPVLLSNRLSAREEEIVKLLLLGKRNSEIAQELSLSTKTIKGYMTTLMGKLNVRNRLEVVLAAQKLNPAAPRTLQAVGAPCRGTDTLALLVDGASGEGCAPGHGLSCPGESAKAKGPHQRVLKGPISSRSYLANRPSYLNCGAAFNCSFVALTRAFHFLSVAFQVMAIDAGATAT